MAGKLQTLPVGMITLDWIKALLDFHAEAVGMSGRYRRRHSLTRNIRHILFLSLVWLLVFKKEPLDCFQS